MNYFFENTNFRLVKRKSITAWIQNIINAEKKITGNICFVFCSDDYLLEINRKYLKRTTLTDVIAFDYSEKNHVSGDIYISIERVKYNAVKFKKSFINELYRVMAHGILHLAGYSDHNTIKRLDMQRKENSYLSKIVGKMK